MLFMNVSVMTRHWMPCLHGSSLFCFCCLLVSNVKHLNYTSFVHDFMKVHWSIVRYSAVAHNFSISFPDPSKAKLTILVKRRLRPCFVIFARWRRSFFSPVMWILDWFFTQNLICNDPLLMYFESLWEQL